MKSKVKQPLGKWLAACFLLLLTILVLFGCGKSRDWMKARATDTDPQIDFSSCRLVLLTEDPEVLRDKDTLLGSYGSVHLLSFATEEETEAAYDYYKDKVNAVEPDATILGAEETVEATGTKERTETPDPIPMTEEANPITLLDEMDGSTPTQESHGVIALIDTGVAEQDGIIDRVSVLDEALDGGVHGQQMVDAIKTQDPNAQILSIRALNNNGFGTISSLVAAMEYAMEQDVNYINLSLYAKTTLSTSVLEQEIIKANEAGILVIGAAGNSGADVADYMPGSVEEAYIIGAANVGGARLSTSNYGKTVDYNVVANSTSEATALFTGYVSANGLDAVETVVNKGFIYAGDYEWEDPTPPDLSEEGTVPEEPPEENIVGFQIIGDGTVTYHDGTSEYAIEDEQTFPLPEANTTLTFSGDAYLFVQRLDTNDFVGTYAKVSAEEPYLLSFAEPNDYLVAVIYDPQRAAEWCSLVDEQQEDDDFMAAASLPGDITYYQKIKHSNNQTIVGQYQVRDAFGGMHWAFCVDHDATSPGANRPVNIVEINNPDLAKVLFYGYGGPGNILGDSNDAWVTTTICVDRAVQGTWETKTIGRDFWNTIQGLPQPTGFHVYIAYTAGALQDLAIWSYNPVEYMDIGIWKEWQDNNNAAGVRPASIQVGLYRGLNNWLVDTSGIPYETVTLSAANNWAYQWHGLLKKDQNGTYYYAIRELSVPAHYTITALNWPSHDWPLGNIVNTLQESYLQIHKGSALPNITNGNRMYSLEGAQYTVYNSQADAANNQNGVAVLTTNAAGDSQTVQLYPQTYYIKETKTPPGYAMDPTIYPVTLSVNHTANSPYRLNVADKPEVDPTGIEMTKIWDGPETASIPTLEGTLFRINYFDQTGMTKQQAATQQPTKTWVLEIRYDKDTNKYYTGLTDDHLMKDVTLNDGTRIISDDFYRNEAGNPVLPLGTYTIQEIQPAAGYTLDGYLKDEKGQIVSTDSEIYMTEVQTRGDMTQMLGGNRYSGENTPITGSITLKKVDSDGRSPLEGATFRCEGQTVQDVYTATTDANGEIVFDNLYPDIYTITEIGTVDGHEILTEPLVVEVPMRVTDDYINEYNVDKNSVIYDPADDIFYIRDFTYEISNHISLEMPIAGGFTGWKVFLPLAGGLVLLGGLGLYVGRKRKTS